MANINDTGAYAVKTPPLSGSEIVIGSEGPGGATINITTQDIADLAAVTPGGVNGALQWNNGGTLDGVRVYNSGLDELQLEGVSKTKVNEFNIGSVGTDPVDTAIGVDAAGNVVEAPALGWEKTVEIQGSSPAEHGFRMQLNNDGTVQYYGWTQTNATSGPFLRTNVFGADPDFRPATPPNVPGFPFNILRKVPLNGRVICITNPAIGPQVNTNLGWIQYDPLSGQFDIWLYRQGLTSGEQYETWYSGSYLSQGGVI